MYSTTVVSTPSQNTPAWVLTNAVDPSNHIASICNKPEHWIQSLRNIRNYQNTEHRCWSTKEASIVILSHYRATKSELLFATYYFFSAAQGSASSFDFQTWATAVLLEWDQGREGKEQTTANRPHFLRPVRSNSLILKASPIKRPRKLEREAK